MCALLGCIVEDKVNQHNFIVTYIYLTQILDLEKYAIVPSTFDIGTIALLPGR